MLKDVDEGLSWLISAGSLKNVMFTVNVTVDHRKSVTTFQKGREKRVKK